MKGNIRKMVRSWSGILLGSVILAAGFVFFINPYGIVPGGTYGASIVLHHLFPSIQVGTFGYMFEIPLLLLSLWLLGSKLGAKTMVASLITPLIMNLMSKAVYPTQQALQALDASQMLDGRLDMSNHLILAVIFGSLLIGLGAGIVVNSGATTGGSDIIALLMQKYLQIRFSSAILVVDGLVVLFGLLVIGLSAGAGHEAVFLSFYSLVSIHLISRVLARTINGAKDEKLIFVISATELAPLRDFILRDLDRTATCIKSSGLYTGEEKQMLFLVVSYKEVSRVKECVREADPGAFVVVTDAYDTYGEGWKPLPKAGDVQPE